MVPWFVYILILIINRNVYFSLIKEYSKYIAYIVREHQDRVCYVFQCASNSLANKIVQEIRNMFELRTITDRHIRNTFQLSSDSTPKTDRKSKDVDKVKQKDRQKSTSPMTPRGFLALFTPKLGRKKQEKNKEISR